MSRILGYNGWDPLREVWLGDIWPESFYSILPNELEDTFCKLTEYTKRDLAIIQKTFENLGVSVKRPVIENNVNLYLDKFTGSLIKPPITPRDYCGVIGDRLFFMDNNHYYKNYNNLHQPHKTFHEGTVSTWMPHLQEYVAAGEKVIFSPEAGINTAHIVRIGCDLYLDNYVSAEYHSGMLSDARKEELWSRDLDRFKRNVLPLFENEYRCHYLTNGGHADGCLAPLRPGLLLSTHYWPDYDSTFPNWEKIAIQEPTFQNLNVSLEKRWRIPGMDNAGNLIDDYLEKNMSDWIGDFRESVFETNLIVIDEKNIMCIGVHDKLFSLLESYGITVHPVPHSCVSFWDGGLHCITLDIHRDSVKKDYFPERGQFGLGMLFK